MGKKSRRKRSREKAKRLDKQRPGSAQLPWWLFLLLLAVPLFAFLGTISYEFVYDDEQQILRNPWIRDWTHLGSIFTTDVWRFSTSAQTTNYYRPLHMMIYVLGYRLSGLEPYGYHILNILLHSGCSLLVALFAFRLTASTITSAASALIFALHPVHAESVAWIAAVTDPLCAVFYFGALYFYIRDAQEPGNRLVLLGALACFLGALLSKEMAFTFPLVALWLDWSLHRKFRWSRYGMFAAVFAIYSVLRVAALTKFLVHQVPLQIDPYVRFLSSIVLTARYVIKMFVPYGLNPFHVFNPTTSILDVKFLLSLLALAAYATAAWLFRAQRQALFASGFCVLTLIPLLNISGLGESISADRYLYIPSLGASLLIPLGAKRIWHLWPGNTVLPAPRIACVFLFLLLAGSTWLLWNTSWMWRDPYTLYTETLRRSPGAVLIANNMARYYFYKGDYDKAEQWYRKTRELWDQAAVKSANRLSNAYAGLGGVYYQRGKMELALEHFNKAYEITPRDVSVLQNLGSVYVALEDYRSALKYYEMALNENPRNEVTYNNLSAIYLTAKRYDLAIEHARKALEIFPLYGDAYVNLGRAYAAKDMKIEARHAFLSARQVDPGKATVIQSDLDALGASK